MKPALNFYSVVAFGLYLALVVAVVFTQWGRAESTAIVVLGALSLLAALRR